MSCRACVVFDDELTDYDFGPTHPLSPLRVKLTMRLAAELGVVGDRALPQVPAAVADDDLFGMVHAPDYISAVRAVRLVL